MMSRWVQRAPLAFSPVHGRCVEMLIKGRMQRCLTDGWVAASCTYPTVKGKPWNTPKQQTTKAAALRVKGKVSLLSCWCKQEHVLARFVSCLLQCAVAYRLRQSLCAGKASDPTNRAVEELQIGPHGPAIKHDLDC